MSKKSFSANILTNYVISVIILLQAKSKFINKATCLEEL